MTTLGSGRRTIYCKKPDHDNPKLECGFPLPCPYHTAIIDLSSNTTTIPFGIRDKKDIQAIKKLAKAMKSK